MFLDRLAKTEPSAAQRNDLAVTGMIGGLDMKITVLVKATPFLEALEQ